MPFDIESAKKSGYSETEIADYLASQSNFDIGNARKSGYNDAEIISHLSQSAKIEPASDMAKPKAPSGYLQGLGDPIDALAQTMTHILPQPIVSAVNKFNNWLVDKGVPFDRIPEGGMDQAIAQKEQEYQAQRQAAGETGFDWGRLAGNVANPVNLMPIGGAARAATIPGKIGMSAARGAVTSGLLNPVTSGNYETEKAKQIALGGLVGGAMTGVGQLAKGAVKQVLGGTTGTSAETIGEAFKAGVKGDKSFVGNMRGNISFDDVVDTAKQGLDKMRSDRNALYRSGMVDIKGDKTVLSMNAIEAAINEAKKIGTHEGVTYNKDVGGVLGKINDLMELWRTNDPAKFHTPEGLDALKQGVRQIMLKTEPHTQERLVADKVYGSIKSTIEQQAPKYAEVMKDYAKASDLVMQIEKTMSLGEKTSRDTAVRKLQSLLRNNVNTNYGNRTSLAKKLEEQGGVSLMPSVAGQSMSSLTPRGMVGALEKTGLGAGGLFALMHNPAALPAIAAATPLTSPRLVGEAAYGLGKARGLLGRTPDDLQGLLMYSPQLTGIYSTEQLRR